MASTDPAAFTYPPVASDRRHGPDGYADYRSYRPWLRDEFAFRCAYCLMRERWGQVSGQFDLDHFVPQIQSSNLAPHYDNLVYSCHSCNLRKQDHELPNLILSAEHVRVYEDGRIVGLTPEAERIIRLLWLNTPQSVEWRRLWIRVVQLAQEDDEELYRTLLGYPDELPDLSRLAPESNSKPDGINQSFYARRVRGELPDVYVS